jgi:hypothetical protein
MPNAILTSFDETSIGSGGQHFIAFTPVEAGTFTIQIVAQRVPTAKQAPNGYWAKINLFRPGFTGPFQTRLAPLANPTNTLSHNVTAAELAVPGGWTCQIQNPTPVDIVYDTTINLPTPYPFQTATFDIGLLDAILREAGNDVGIEVHLITDSAPPGDAGMSYVTWTPVLTQLLNGLTRQAFVAPDLQVQTNDLDINAAVKEGLTTALPDILIFRMALGTYPIPGPFVDTGSGRLITSLDFGSGTVDCLNSGLIDIRVDSLTVQLSIGLDGSVQAIAAATANARLLGFQYDVSGPVQDAVNGAVAAFAKPRVIAPFLNRFFVTLMRLNDTQPPGLNSERVFFGNAQITNLSVQGQTLTAQFFSVPRSLSIALPPPGPILSALPPGTSPTLPTSVGGLS